MTMEPPLGARRHGDGIGENHHSPNMLIGVSIVMGVPQELAGWFISWKLPEKAVTLYGGFHKVGIPSSLDGLFHGQS